MFDTPTLILFVTSSVLLALSPGPDNIFVLTLSVARGALAGVVTTLGLCSGLIVHTLAVALGVAVFIQQSALAFTLLKLLGAAYLLWLAWKAWRAPAESIHSTQNRESFRRLYIRGVVMNVMNPKVSLFFLAFLPQFVSPGQGPVTLQVALLGLMFMISAFAVFSCIALGAAKVGSFLRRGKSGQWLNRLSALVFAGLALKLAFSER